MGFFGTRNIDFKNLAENLLIAVFVIAATAIVTYWATSKSSQQTTTIVIEGLRPAIVKAIEKETSKIENTIDLKIDKIKKSDSLKIIVDQVPDNELNQTLHKDNVIPAGYYLIKRENLTRRQEKRLGLR